MKDFRTALSERIILLDGAMGTEIYARGVFINQAYEALVLSNPAMIREIHRAYVDAGADVLTTNTFGANPMRMKEYGLEEQFAEINKQAVIIAREESRGRAWVGASMGPLGQRMAPLGTMSPGDFFQEFKTWAEALLSGEPDLFILETFTDTKELWQAVRAVRSLTQLPIIASMAFDESRGNPVKDAAEVLTSIEQWPVDAIGSNCVSGPRGLLDIVERTASRLHKPLLAMPNAGLPQVVDGRTLYMASPEYMAEFARRFVQKGARVVGGCCGTTPQMIREMRSFIRSVAPMTQIETTVEMLQKETENAVEMQEPTPIVERSEFARKLYSGEFCISVELDPPRGLDPSRSIEGAKFLLHHGIDVINIADGPRAVARMGPLPMAQMVKADSGMEAVTHYCCRDRNLLGMQMDLIGANALGQRNILAVTGDPPKMGSYPDATPVFDIDSIGLITFLQMMNRGLDFAGRPLGGKTEFFVGAGCNPGHIDLDLEVHRFGKKVEAGAEFFFSQPVYDQEMLFAFLERTKAYAHIPFLVGILPLASYKNAEFLHNEVPGMQIPDNIRERMRNAPDRKAQRRVGIEVARETLQAVYQHDRISGVYIYPPFGSYKAVLKVIEVIGR